MWKNFIFFYIIYDKLVHWDSKANSTVRVRTSSFFNFREFFSIFSHYLLFVVNLFYIYFLFPSIHLITGRQIVQILILMFRRVWSFFVCVLSWILEGEWIQRIWFDYRRLLFELLLPESLIFFGVFFRLYFFRCVILENWWKLEILKANYESI